MKIPYLPITLFVLLFVTGCSDSSIDLVKNGNFPGYPNVSIGKILDGSFSGTKWSSQETSKGEVRVMFEGAITPKIHAAFKDQALRLIHAELPKGG